MSVCGWGGWSEQGRRPARRSGCNPFKSRAASLRRPGAASRSERASGSDASHLPACINRGQAPKYACRANPCIDSARRIFRCLTPIYARPGNRLQTDPADPDTTNIEMRSQSPNFRRVPTSSSQESDERPTRASRPRKRPWDIGRSPGSPLASRAGSAPRSRSPTTPGGWPARHPVASAPRRQRSTLSRWPVNATSDGPCTLVLRTASPRTVVPAQKVPSTRRDLWERNAHPLEPR